MSSSGRYQSRLFSFFSHQSLRLKDKTSQAWRQIKLAAVWGTQIALYPIYAVFQSGRLLGRQMGQAVRQTFPRLRTAKPETLDSAESLELAADAPISRLLDRLDGGALELARCSADTARIGEGSPLNPPMLGDFEEKGNALILQDGGSGIRSLNLRVQGFASLLERRSLVLVGVGNEVLDVLTEEQQGQLQQQIIWEIANYWRQRKLRLGAAEPIGTGSNTFLPLPKEKANLLPPVRVFRRVMAWMQLSPVAIATNLFQESRLAAALPADFEPFSDLPQLPAALSSESEIDHQVNELFSGQSEPLPLLAWVKNQAIGLADFSKSLGGFLQGSSIVLYDPLPKSEPDEWVTEPPFVPPNVAKPVRVAKPSGSTKPWLSMEDFFAGEFLGVTGSGQIVKQPDGAVKPPDLFESPAMGRPEAPPDSELTAASSVAIDPSVPESIHQPLLESETWEAEVTSVSYETHPLEQLLKWLDSGMLWIEQKLEQVWNWVNRS
jgi:hypothetical protein